jgi:hypothetical protein
MKPLGRRHAGLTLVLIAGLVCVAGMRHGHGAEGELAGWPAPRLSLEDVPAPRVPASEDLPPPATWPILRHDRRLRILVLTNVTTGVADYQRIARRCNAEMDFCFYPLKGLAGGTGADWRIMAHTNDQWIEGKKNPSPEEVSVWSASTGPSPTFATCGRRSPLKRGSELLRVFS